MDDLPASDVSPTGPSRRDFLKTVAAGLAAGALLGGTDLQADAQTHGVQPNINAIGPPLAAAPGAQPWQATLPIYSGTCNIATGNAQIFLPICAWSGRGGGLNFSLVFNSQSTRSSALGPKWTYSYRMAVVGTNPAIVIGDDGTETSYSLSGSIYTAPAGIYDTLVHNGDGSWTLTRKNGTVYSFRASDGLLTSIEDLNSNTISLTYSGSYLSTITDAASRILTLGYTGTLLTSITDCQSRVWNIGYDSSSRVNTVSEPLLGGVTYSRTIGYTSSNNNVASLQNRVGKTWLYSYGSGSLLTNVLLGTTDPDGHTTSSSYATTTNTGSTLPGYTGWPSTTLRACPWIDLDGHTIQHGLDSSGRRVATVDSAGNQANWTFDTSHNRTAYQDQAGNTWQYQFDTAGNEKQVTDPYGKILTRTFGSYGSIATQIDALSNETQWFYNATGNLTEIIDANLGNTIYVPNTDGSVNQVTDPASHVIEYGYDIWGHRSSITVVESGTTSFVTSFVFDTGSHITQRMDALSRETTYTPLDAWGRTTTIAYPTTGNPSITLTLDAESRWTQSVDSTGTRTYGYDSWSRCNAMADPRGNTTATYYDNNWLHTITELPSGDVTTFTWDPVGNLLSEVRTGTRPYSGTYTYYADNQRKTAVVITNGVTTHNGMYTYDGAGRLVQCVDTATGLTEIYTWNNDGTLASAPGSGYTKLFFFNEEKQLVTIEHNTGGTITTAYQHGYAADGGRRWKKDIANNVWTWYPCGASCSAGALVEQSSDLTGATWTTSALYLRTGGSCGSQLIRRVSGTDSEYHHADPKGNFGVISSSTAVVLSNNLYDNFGVQQYVTGTAQTPYRLPGRLIEPDVLRTMQECISIGTRSLNLQSSCGTGYCTWTGNYSCVLVGGAWLGCEYVCYLLACLTPGCPCPPVDILFRGKLPWRRCPGHLFVNITGSAPIGIGLL